MDRIPSWSVVRKGTPTKSGLFGENAAPGWDIQPMIDVARVTLFCFPTVFCRNREMMVGGGSSSCLVVYLFSTEFISSTRQELSLFLICLPREVEDIIQSVGHVWLAYELSVLSLNGDMRKVLKNN